MSGPSLKTKRQRISKTSFSDSSDKKSKWTVKEMRQLITGLEKFGFGDITNIAAMIHTRSEIEVKYFMQKWTDRVFKINSKRVEMNLSDGNPLYKLFSKSYVKTLDDYSKFPALAVWKKAMSVMNLSKHKNIDYSDVIISLFKAFAAEEEKYEYENLPHLAVLYNYIAHTLVGNVPPKLNSENNILFNYLLGDVRRFIKANDFKTIEEYFGNFLGPIQFVPAKASEGERNITLKEFLTEREMLEEGGSETNEKAGPSGHCSSVEMNGLVNNKPSTSTRPLVAADQSDGDESDEADKSSGREKGIVIEVPTHLYELFKNHEKVQGDLNPLSVPLWVQKTSQKQVKDYYDSKEIHLK